MTIRAFAAATAQKFNLELGPLLRRTHIAEHVSQGMCRLGDIDLRRTLPGFGLVFDGYDLYPTVLVNRWEYDHPERLSDYPEVLHYGISFPDIVELLRSVSDAYDPPKGERPEFVAEDLRILPVSHGVKYASPGTSIQSTRLGRVGPHVTWNNGNSEGFLTAGHVAQTLGGNVTDGSGSLLGRVVWTFDPSKTSLKLPELDAALVELDSAYVSSTGQYTTIVAANDRVSVSSKLSANIMGFGHIVLGSNSDVYAECYMTDTRITKTGDSGDRVVHQGDIVGMVIGGFSARDMTIVQAIDYQLN